MLSSPSRSAVPAGRVRRIARNTAALVATGLGAAAVGCDAVDPGGSDPASDVRSVTRSTVFGAEEGAGALSGVFDVEVAPDGHVVVSEPQFARVAVYRPDGSFSHTVGRQGQGPGEYRWPGDVAWRGDSLTVLDFSTGSLHFFGLDGTYHDRVSFNVLGEGQSFPFRPMVALADGSVLGMQPMPMGQGAEETWTRTDREGAVEDTLWVRRLAGRQIRVEAGGQFALGGVPLDHGPEGTTPPGGAFVVVADPGGVVPRPDGGEAAYRLTRIDLSGDTVAVADVPYEPRPPTPVQIDSIAAVRAGSLVRRGVPEAAAVVAWMEQVPWPGTWPATTRIRAGDDGSVWVRRERPENGVVRWDVFDAALEPAGTTLLPAALDVLWVSDTAVYGVELDSLDVPTVVRYAIGR